MRSADVSGIVLGGGLSSRMGKDKSGLTLDGKSMAVRALEALDELFDELIYVTNDPDLRQIVPATKIARDEIPHLGPLGGILAGLRACESPRAFVVACDMPFVSIDLVRFLIAHDVAADIIVPQIDGRLEPLHAVYSRSCIPHIADQLAAGSRQIIGFYDQVNTDVIDEKSLRLIDPELRSFFNINTADDLRAAEAIVDSTR